MAREKYSTKFQRVWLYIQYWLFHKGFGSNVEFFAANDESEGALSPPPSFAYKNLNPRSNKLL
jgi:hypothetical protein